MKVVINKCHGGFGLSTEAIIRYAEIKGIKLYEYEPNVFIFADDDESGEKVYFFEWNIDRKDSALVQVVEELGYKANTRHSELKVVEIPDNVDWDIGEYDGTEWVAEKHRTWN